MEERFWEVWCSDWVGRSISLSDCFLRRRKQKFLQFYTVGQNAFFDHSGSGACKKQKMQDRITGWCNDREKLFNRLHLMALRALMRGCPGKARIRPMMENVSDVWAGYCVWNRVWKAAQQAILAAKFLKGATHLYSTVRKNRRFSGLADIRNNGEHWLGKERKPRNYDQRRMN